MVNIVVLVLVTLSTMRKFVQHFDWKCANVENSFDELQYHTSKLHVAKWEFYEFV